MYNEGISKTGDVLDMGTEVGIIEKRGAYYSYGETRLGQGRENVKTFLRENPELLEEISQKIRSSSSLPSGPPASVESDMGEEEDTQADNDL